MLVTQPGQHTNEWRILKVGHASAQIGAQLDQHPKHTGAVHAQKLRRDQKTRVELFRVAILVCSSCQQRPHRDHIIRQVHREQIRNAVHCLAVWLRGALAAEHEARCSDQMVHEIQVDIGCRVGCQRIQSLLEFTRAEETHAEQKVAPFRVIKSLLEATDCFGCGGGRRHVVA